ncbi:MAG: hypothetical protein PHQ20_00640 [Candidatus Moranbacteria bacterium]|nr:hypothetical protein [Candidatus Moranbacteria bacterium]
MEQIRGKPTSPEAIKKVTKNLKVQRQHGAFEFLRTGIAPVPSCSQCIFSGECQYFRKESKSCQAVLEAQEEIYNEIASLQYMTPTDLLIADRFVKNFCFLLVTERWLASVGPFQIQKKGLDIQPVLNIKTNYERLVLRQADALGIGPQARARLNLTTVQTFNFAEALQKAKPINNETAKVIISQQDETDN